MTLYDRKNQTDFADIAIGIAYIDHPSHGSYWRGLRRPGGGQDLGNLNTYSAAIQKADVVGTRNNEGLHISNNTFVVFATNDQAFTDLSAGTMDASITAPMETKI